MEIVKHGPRITWTPLLALTAGGMLLCIFHLNSDLWLDEIGRRTERMSRFDLPYSSTVECRAQHTPKIFHA